jgi:hypothetical protein
MRIFETEKAKWLMDQVKKKQVNPEQTHAHHSHPGHHGAHKTNGHRAASPPNS